MLKRLFMRQIGPFGGAQLHVLLFVGLLAFFLMFVAGFRLCRQMLFVNLFGFLVLVVFLLFFFLVMRMVFFALGDLVRLVQRLRLVLIELGSTDQAIRFRTRLRLFVLGFHQAG